jgi:hypothetical protein
LIDLAAGHEAHGFALSYFPLPMGGRAVDRSPVSLYYRTYTCVAKQYKIIKFHVTEVLISKRHMGPLNGLWAGGRLTVAPCHLMGPCVAY